MDSFITWIIIYVCVMLFSLSLGVGMILIILGLGYLIATPEQRQAKPSTKGPANTSQGEGQAWRTIRWLAWRRRRQGIF